PVAYGFFLVQEHTVLPIPREDFPEAPTAVFEIRCRKEPQDPETVIISWGIDQGLQVPGRQGFYVHVRHESWKELPGGPVPYKPDYGSRLHEFAKSKLKPSVFLKGFDDDRPRDQNLDLALER